jgi:FkbM family methyltransferase
MPELHCASEIGSTTISLSTLDEWALANDIRQIDFLKLDTQGAELDVLRGGEQSLSPVRALEIEVEFNPIYIGQPLF